MKRWNYTIGGWPAEGEEFANDCEAEDAERAALSVADHLGLTDGDIVCVEDSETGERSRFEIGEVTTYTATRLP